MSTKLKILISVVILSGFTVLLYSISETISMLSWSIVVFMAFIILSEELAVPLPKEGAGYVSVSLL
ncbi:hypothetical protein [Natranaerobius thermophilus]|uniref:hypothetical protein n=1 Tax=Natranaerobius thermophilus TaxID=375929 RepID=UPI002F40BFC8